MGDEDVQRILGDDGFQRVNEREFGAVAGPSQVPLRAGFKQLNLTLHLQAAKSRASPG